MPGALAPKARPTARATTGAHWGTPARFGRNGTAAAIVLRWTAVLDRWNASFLVGCWSSVGCRRSLLLSRGRRS
jgi:hypothetical protein